MLQGLCAQQAFLSRQWDVGFYSLIRGSMVLNSIVGLHNMVFESGCMNIFKQRQVILKE